MLSFVLIDGWQLELSLQRPVGGVMPPTRDRGANSTQSENIQVPGVQKIKSAIRQTTRLLAKVSLLSPGLAQVTYNVEDACRTSLLLMFAWKQSGG
jgi:hypothetical protein